MKNEDLRFNINLGTEFKAIKDLVQIKFDDGTWITVGPDIEDIEPETPEQNIARLKERMGSESHMSLWVPLELIKYDSTGRSQQIDFHIKHQGMSFNDAVEKYHNPRKAV